MRVDLNSDVMPKGMAFTRAAIARALAEDEEHRIALAANRWRDERTVNVIRGEVSALNGISGGTGAELTAYSNATIEFMGVVREASLLGKLGTRRIPPTTRMLLQHDVGAVAAWVGEGQATPLTTAAFTDTSLKLLKVMALMVSTMELLQAAGNEGEAIIRADLIAATVQALDLAFLDPTNNGVAGVKPASAFDGAVALPMGSDLDDAVAEAVHMLDGDKARAVAIMRPELASYLAKTHEGLTVRGGEAFGLPVFTSSSMPLDADGSHQIGVIDPGRTVATWGEPSVSVARHATVEMLDASLAMDSIGVVPGTAASMVNLWQTNSVGFNVVSRANWITADGSAILVDGISGAGGS